MEKRILTTEDVAELLGVAKSYVYKLTYKKLIPHYKPNGKCVFFKREEVEDWIFSNRIATDEELGMKVKYHKKKKQ